MLDYIISTLFRSVLYIYLYCIYRHLP